jgi:hypothetical protein
MWGCGARGMKVGLGSLWVVINVQRSKTEGGAFKKISDLEISSVLTT